MGEWTVLPRYYLICILWHGAVPHSYLTVMTAVNIYYIHGIPCQAIKYVCLEQYHILKVL